ncbi:hypothetical protein EMIT079MI2_380014 [Bacillus sp. IT-79MI2]
MISPKQEKYKKTPLNKAVLSFIDRGDFTKKRPIGFYNIFYNYYLFYFRADGYFLQAKGV